MTPLYDLPSYWLAVAKDYCFHMGEEDCSVYDKLEDGYDQLPGEMLENSLRTGQENTHIPGLSSSEPHENSIVTPQPQRMTASPLAAPVPEEPSCL